VLERADEVGGTWRANHYPGCCCDFPSHVYSYSFELNPAWERGFAPQPEILGYLKRCAEKYGVRGHIRFGHEVTEARWDEAARRWEIETSEGAFTADFLINAGGALSEPKDPDLPGLDSFAGTTFHSAQWDHDHEFRGERVAVIGTGASSIQFVPAIQPEVGRLYLFQRTPRGSSRASITRSPGSSTCCCASPTPPPWCAPSCTGRSSLAWWAFASRG